MRKALTQEEVEKRFEEKGWEIVDKYIDARIKVKVICPYCKNTTLVIAHNIFNGNTKSCGCISHKLTGEQNSKASREKSLGFLYPEIAKLYSKNNEKSIFEIYPKSNDKYLWICEKYEHEYENTPTHIVGRSDRCPYCSGHKILEGFNDLLSQQPDLASEWHPTKNELKPNSNKKVWWKCNKCNNEWNAIISSRSKGNGCPNCSPSSKGEEQIKEFFIEHNIKFEQEKRFLTCKNKNTLPFDFYLPYQNILIEFNGCQHYMVETNNSFGGQEKFEQRQRHDQIKINWAKENNINLLIIRYDENIEEKLKEYINEFIGNRKNYSPKRDRTK